MHALLNPASKALDCGWYYTLCYIIVYVHVSNELNEKQIILHCRTISKIRSQNRDKMYTTNTYT
jgi:hypothetical protein